MRTVVVALAGLGVVLAACGRGAVRDTGWPPDKRMLAVSSVAFAGGEAIPAKYTADGANVSPPIAWSEGPAATATYAVVVEDPDAPGGTWFHWVLWNVGDTHLAEDVAAAATGPSGSTQGRTSFGRSGWGGPSPPSGTHRYYFQAFALDARVDLAPAAGAEELRAAMKGHVLAWGELMGTYAAK